MTQPFIALRDGSGTTVQDLFAEQAAQTPNATAIAHVDGTLTYAELNACANRLAARLLDMGVSPGNGVVFICDRNFRLLIALLGILKTRAYFIPLDPTYPAARINYTIDDAQPFAIVTDRTADELRAMGIEANAPVVHLSPEDAVAEDPSAYANPEALGDGDDFVYSIYTSGSTGKPKGTLNYHRSVLNTNRWMVEHFGVGPDTRMLATTSIAFDLTGKIVASPLLSGGCVVLYDSPLYDPQRIRRAIVDFQVNATSHTPTGIYGLIEDGRPETFAELAGLERVIIIGEALHLEPLRAWASHAAGRTTIINGYGPTECADQVAWHEVTPADLAAGGVCVLGRAIPNVELSVRNADLSPVSPGEKGEMCIQGVCVGAGYPHLPEKTAEVFVDDPHPGPFQGTRMYRTGDLVSQRADGVLVFHGRLDHQVKVRGYRVELVEIEKALNACPGVLESVVTAPELAGGERFLAAYIRAESEAGRDAAALARQLAESLPDYMLPATYTFMDSFPTNVNLKVDRGALPVPVRGRPDLAVAYRRPVDPVEQKVAEIWAQVLGFDGIGADDPFFEVGGNSLLAVRVTGRLTEALGAPVSIVQFFDTPTIAGLSHALTTSHPQQVQAWTGAPTVEPPTVAPAPAPPARHRDDAAGSDIAIVGMAARVPGAATVDEFWRNLLDGVDSLRILTPDELAAAGVPKALADSPDYVPVSGWVDDSDAFDHAYFGYTPREAERIDPQQRLLLELAATAFEDAGIATDRSARRTGIYASVATNSYFPRNVMAHDGIREYGLGYPLLGNDKDYAGTRIAYKLGLNGPALTVQTACSSSGTALHLAAQALITGDCDVALAGGAALPWQYQFGHEHVAGGALSADGRVHAFDAAASGMVLTGGGACMVLMRVGDALADGHTIHAVIRATALNNDGEDKASFTAPSVAGQREVIRTALDRAGVDARTIGALEAHGTGTPLGDPIEVTAITQAWREDTEDVGYCAIGSVKSNIGHLDAGAAAIGAVKMALMLREGERPATLNYDAPNPECRFESSPFVVNDTRTPWISDEPRRGALSSFGFGGTNFHAIFEQGPASESAPSRREWQVLRLSAKTEAALAEQRETLAKALAESTDVLADVAHTLDVGRNRRPYRAAVVARSTREAAERLASAQHTVVGDHPSDRPHVVFTFPGQGAQHPGMGRRLYETEAVFRNSINQCADILLPELGVDLRDLLYGERDDAAESLRNTQLAQPAIFAVSYATAKLWLSWGLDPQMMIGHSVGELVAATISGVFSVEDALGIIAERARLMASMPSGGMLAVRISESAAAPYLDGVSIAGVNSPQVTILSGPHDALGKVRERLEADGVGTTVLHTSHAFHSAMMDPVLDPFAEAVSRYPRHAPHRPFYSSLTGEPITDEQAQDPRYWAEQLRGAVRFGPAVAHVAQTPGTVLLECGPGQNLTTSARQTFADPDAPVDTTAIASLPHAAVDDADDAEHLGTAVARLFVAGVELDDRRVNAGEKRMRISLPGYPFARVRHWLNPGSDPIPVAATATQHVEAATPTEPSDAAADRTTLDSVRELFLDVAGVQLTAADDHRSFLELGFDSLLLTQIAAQLNQRMGASLRFRQLLEEFPTPAALADELAQSGATSLTTQASTTPMPADDGARQPMTLRQGARITTSGGETLTDRQRTALDALIARYTERTAGSRAYADEHRPYLADPRAVSGFRPLWKDLVYPLVSAGSQGPRFTDVDGNEYVDLTNGFGSIFFGHRPDFMVEAVHRQIDTDIIIGPQSPIVGDCARMFAELTGHERVTFCNTGSEAVLAAIRLARTVTGRNLIVQHEGDYHGINDEVLVRGTPSGRSIPATPGVPPEAVANTLVLEYGSEESLAILRERAHELAAIVIEPVQSGNPGLQPADYVRDVRKICDESGTALIIDEVICGFRVHRAGAQGVWGVKADIGCYGKVFAAGMPVGALAGSARFMDALDGGAWQFGDDSMPEVGVTYFAGTFVRHPLTMAVVHATLRHMIDHPELQERVNAAAETLVARLHALFADEGLPMHIGRFGSLMKPAWDQPLAFGELFYYFLREAGVNAWDGRPNYITTVHGEAELDAIVDGFAHAIAQMKAGGFLDDLRPTAELLGMTASADGSTLSLPSTEPQREVWFASMFTGANTAYNEGLGIHYVGKLDESALRLGLQTLLDRHDALRSHFSRDGRSLVITTTAELDLETYDFADDPDRDDRLSALITEQMGQEFTLSAGPLVRFTLVRMAPDDHRLLLIAHHAVCDGWSAAVLLTELGATYSAEVAGQKVALSPAPRYADYCAVERSFLASAEGRRHRDYWIETLRAAPPPPQLPPDRDNPTDLRASRIDVAIDPRLGRRVRELGAANGAGFVATMLTGFAALLHRFCNQEDIVIGLAAAGQSLHDQGDLVGHCVNMLPLRVNISDTDAFGEAITRTQGVLLDAHDHQGVTYGSLLDDLHLVRDERPPLISVVFNIDVRDDDITHSGLDVSYEALVRQCETFEFFFNVVDTGDSIILEASYRAGLYSEEQVRSYLSAYVDLLSRMTTDPDGTIGA